MMVFLTNFYFIALAFCSNLYSQNLFVKQQIDTDPKILNINSENYNIYHYYYTSQIIMNEFSENLEINYFNDKIDCSRLIITNSNNDSINIT